ncbi:hypothetical protein GCM10009114_27840 [Aliiglaciecola litoralis]|uniref:Uncharacterized protein n=1 Tax=Aliiglaciecola litoralis TaxID=582857 RepID=A0ABN1LP90_9ALTE
MASDKEGGKPNRQGNGFFDKSTDQTNDGRDGDNTKDGEVYPIHNDTVTLLLG